MNVTVTSLSAEAEKLVLNADQIYGLAKQRAKEKEYIEFKSFEFYDYSYQFIKNTEQVRVERLQYFLKTTQQFCELINDSTIIKDLSNNIDAFIRTMQLNTTKALTKLHQSFYSYIKTTALAGVNEKMSAAVFRYVNSIHNDNDFELLENEIKRYAQFANEIADITKKNL